MSYEIPSPVIRKLITTTGTLAVAVLLAGCAPEAPPCNDAEVTSSILDLVGQAHDDHLKDLQVKSKDIATIALEAPGVTAYDDKLKIRSCKVIFTVQASADKVQAMNQYMAVMSNPLASALDSLNPFAAVTNPGGTPLQKAKAEIAQFQTWNQNAQASTEPIRRSLVYRVQKEEGKSTFFVTTNVNVAGTVPYMRVIALAEVFAKEQSKHEAKEADAEAKKRAEIDRLSATGTWRREVNINTFRWDRDPERCTHVNPASYCFVGQSDDLLGRALYTISSGPQSTEASRAFIRKSLATGVRACLIGLKKTSEKDVYSFTEWSTMRDEKGRLQDCLPGAAEAEAAAKGKTSAAQPAGASAAPVAQAVAPTAAAAPASGSGPESLMSLITKYEPCGEEAVCLHTGKGNVVWMQAGMMRRMDYALLDKAISSKTPVCLRDVTRTDAKNFAADGLDSAC